MSNILLIDGMNLLIAQNSAVNIMDINSEPIGMYLGSISQIRFYIDKFKPSKVFFILDGINAGERRRKLYPDYKHKRRVTGRKSKIVLNGGDKEDREEIETDDGFQRQMLKIYEFLKSLPVVILLIPYCEGDDIISYLTLKNKAKHKITVISTDKDYLQLVDDNVNVYNWKKKKLYTQLVIEEEFGIKAQNFIYWKVILGDNSDNIKNIQKIGQKTFDALFQKALKNTIYAELQDFFQLINDYDLTTLEKKYHKFISLLKEAANKKKMTLNYQLIKLDESVLKYNHIGILKQQLEEQDGKPVQKMLLKAKMFKDEFDKLYGSNKGMFNADKFLNPFLFLNSRNELDV